MTFTTSDNVKLNYEIKGEGKTLVLLHGWSGNSDNFRPVVDQLAQDYKVVSYDHRGHGFSEHTFKGYSLERLAKDLSELIDHLELSDILLVGWSMGAMTLFDYVRQFGTEKLRGTVIIDMTPKLINDDDWKLGLYDGAYKNLDKMTDLTQMFENFETFTVDFMYRVLPYMTDELMLDMAKEQLASGIPPASLLALTGLWHAMAAADYREDLKKIDVPTRIFRGQIKSLYSRKTSEYIAERIPGTEIVEFENATHMLVVENPDKTQAELRKFAQELWQD